MTAPQEAGGPWLDMSRYPDTDPDTVLSPDDQGLLTSALAVDDGALPDSVWEHMLAVVTGDDADDPGADDGTGDPAADEGAADPLSDPLADPLAEPAADGHDAHDPGADDPAAHDPGVDGHDGDGGWV